MNRVVFSSARTDWRTPADVYDELNREFSFDFDPCPPDPTFDGLAVPWGASNFVNPPYGRELPKWVAKAHREAVSGKTVVMLVPSRTDTRWWHGYVMRADEVRYIKGRLRFQGARHGAPFPSCLVIWRGSQRHAGEAGPGSAVAAEGGAPPAGSDPGGTSERGADPRAGKGTER
ncbi:MAG: phage N-6-adenine-methyltransferase [Bifidobacteriaceae bacterium]|nr:phage N-6-adenine-methyltransferase [Bifidobacteriaceae bacterium]